MATSTQIPRDSMADRVRHALFRRILSGELEPGKRLVELQLARELNTSQGPVREALRELEAMGLIVTIPYKGSYVRQVTDQEIREAYAVRALLEQHAGQLAAPVLVGRTGELREEAAAIRAAALAGDTETYAHHDMRFHRLIVEACDNQVLLRTWDSLTLAVRVRLWVMQGRLDIVATEADHWGILAALEAGDGELAGRLLHQHIMGIIDARRPAATEDKPAGRPVPATV